MFLTTHHPEHVAKGHIRSIDGLRGVIALYVLLFHVWYIYGHGPYGIFRFGPAAVMFFTALSGFCLVMATAKHGAEPYGTFLRRCALRLLPSYYAGLAFSLIMMTVFLDGDRGTHWSTSLPVTKAAIVESLALMQSFGGHESKINYAYWFMPIIWHLHLFFPFLFVILRRMGPAAFLILGVALGDLNFQFLRGTIVGLGHYDMIAPFCVGMAGAYALQLPRHRAVLDSRTGRLVLICIITFYFWSLAKNPGAEYVDGLNGKAFSGMAATAILILLSGERMFSKAIFSAKPLVALGTISYGVYLTHAVFIELIDIHVIARFGIEGAIVPWIIAAGTIPLTLIAATLFHALFERRRNATKDPTLTIGITPSPIAS